MSCDSINQSVSITTVLQTISKFDDIVGIVRKLPCLAMLSYFFEIFNLLLSMKFGFKKMIRNRLNKQDNEDGNIQVSFSYFLIYFPDIFITFETYCLLKASMNFLRLLTLKMLRQLWIMIVTLLSIISLIFLSSLFCLN